MSYISIPNSIVTATNKRADKLNENFVAFTDGLSNSQKDLNVANVTTTNRVDVPAISVGGDRTIGGAAKGQRVGIVLHRWHLQEVRPRYPLFSMSGSDPTIEYGAIYMPRAGSLLGFRLWIQCDVPDTANTLTLLFKKNGSTLASGNSVSIPNIAGAVQTDSASWTRGTYPFSAGDKLAVDFGSIYGSPVTHGSLFLEVVFDE